MPLLNDHYISKDYWNLPEGERTELINGKFYAMAPPSRIHQQLVMGISNTLQNYIHQNHGNCKVYPAPFAVNLDADDKDWVEPDISVICDPNKIDAKGCHGAPDWIVEIVSPGSKRMDYYTKLALYRANGVREYWIVDPLKRTIVVYDMVHDDGPVLHSFCDVIKVHIYDSLEIDFSKLHI